MQKLNFEKFLPILHWSKTYQRHHAISDFTAAIIVTLMLVPQALAYAILSGLPPQVGLYASMLPLVVYAFFGTSNTLAIGPVAIAALMTASAIKPFSEISPEMGVEAAVVMALISGFFLLLSGLFRLGFLANFLSHSVISGFISAASIVIATSQLPTLLGYSAKGDNMIELLSGVVNQVQLVHPTTLILSLLTLALLMITRKHGRAFFLWLGCQPFLAQTLTRAVPAILVILGTLAIKADISWLAEVKTVGQIPAGLPSLGLPSMELGMWQALLMPAILISIIGYVESISVAQNLAMKRRERIEPDQELIALGVSNLAAGISAGLPVTGGVSRSVVNMDAGAQTPMAGLLTAFGMLAATYFMATWLGDLPRFILSTTIIIAVLSLCDVTVFKHTWHLSKQDFFALCITFLLTLFVNVEWGITAGVVLSIALHLYKASRPHIALVGQVRGTEHFRNIDRHEVDVCPNVVTMRIDESLFFANIRYLEQRVHAVVAENPQLQHLVLMFSAVNDVDASAVQVLQTLNDHLQKHGIGFHFSEVKGPVMDNLKKSNLLTLLNGSVFLTQYKAYEALACFNLKRT